MLKLLLLIGVLTTAYFIFFKKKSLPKPSNGDRPSAETMIPCATCGTYVQVKESIMSNGHYYCSKECLEETK